MVRLPCSGVPAEWPAESSKIVHFTPTGKKRKEGKGAFFAPKREFYQRSQEDENPPVEPRLDPADPGAQEEEVPGGPQGQGGGHVQPDPPVPQDQGAEEEGQGGQQPEGQVQSPPQQGQGRGPAGGAEQVIDQAQGQPHPQAAEEGLGLGQGVDVHPRNSRPRKVPGRSSSS